MIWIVLTIVVLVVHCIAMSCVALWYREKWIFEARLRIDLQEEWRITDNMRLDLEFQVEQLRSKLPKRDSKGRFCKREEEK